MSTAYATGRHRAVQAINAAITETYWEIGRHIVEFEQKGNLRAEYGTSLLERLSHDMTLLHGKGFDRSNLNRMRQFFIAYPICATLSHKLSWGHIVELLSIEDPLERSFYEKQSVAENWSLRELRRQKKSALFLRLAASKDKTGVLQLAQQGQLVNISRLFRERTKCRRRQSARWHYSLA
ncbi:MAG: DUF1016 N-terminal domain-containing protein [Puniceicoccales bacterium]|nr:DUF1016 N-terminal domain-containing protein [Puniceicoccales bacterium]